jgi:hypothetical protein
MGACSVTSLPIETIYGLACEIYYKLGEKELQTEGQIILIDVGQKRVEQPGLASKLSQIEAVKRPISLADHHLDLSVILWGLLPVGSNFWVL